MSDDVSSLRCVVFAAARCWLDIVCIGVGVLALLVLTDRAMREPLHGGAGGDAGSTLEPNNTLHLSGYQSIYMLSSRI